jgi:[ribosomal protein S5]-alanine N-acetyltransferase
MKLLPVKQTIEENTEFKDSVICQENGLMMTIQFFNKIGYNPPWIGYFAEKEGQLVGSAAFKGISKDNSVEVAYGVFEAFRSQGIGTEICQALVLLALKKDSTIRITARTLPEENHSTQILKKNGFKLLGTVWDEEDGNVWEWLYKKNN